MNLPFGDQRNNQFITNVGLITSSGPHGQNIMAAEWTHHISYSPGLIAVCIAPGKATHENILSTKEFGVSLCATDQTALSSISGGHSGRSVDKIKLIEELGYSFYPATTINVQMVTGAVVNFECTLLKHIEVGSHTMFIGEVRAAELHADKQPLAYHQGQYWKMTETLAKPSDQERERIKKLVERYQKR